MHAPAPAELLPFGAGARRTARVVGAVVSLIGVAALLGWATGTGWLTGAVPGFQPLRVDAAIAYVFAGASLWLLAPGPAGAGDRPGPAPRRVARLAALPMALLGLATFAEYAFGWNLGVDTLLWSAPPEVPGVVPSSGLPPAGALAFVLLGGALVSVDARWGPSPSQTLASGALLIVMLAVTSYVYGDPGALIFSRISVPGSVAVTALAAGTLLARLDRGWLSFLLDRGAAGRAVRLLMPLALATPLILGGLVRFTERVGLHPEDVSLAVFAVGAVAISGAAVAVYGHALRAQEEGRRRVQAALLASETRKAAVIDVALDPVVTIDHEGRIIDFNPAAEDTFGYGRDDVLGRDIAAVLIPERLRERHWAAMERYLRTGEHTVIGRRVEMPALRADGAELRVELAITAIAAFDEPIFTAHLRDITERLRAEEELRDSLREKEVLLREVHHRVKNNLQVISSLLSLEARHAGDAKVELAFRRTAERIRSIATLHERVYRSEDVARIDMATYLRAVAADTGHGQGGGAAGIDVAVADDLRHLSMDVAMPAGLVVGELVRNAVAHGRKGDAPPRIRVTLGRDGEQVLLSVEDDGPGYGSEGDTDMRKGLGLTLVSALARQLGGEVAVGRSVELGGARVNVSVAEPDGGA